MIIAFTGHRNIGGFCRPNPIYDWVGEEIKKLLIKLKPDKVISGMALGADQIAAEVAIELNIPFIAAVPFEKQDKVWYTDDKNHYRELLKKAEKVEILCGGDYAPIKMQWRNIWMVDNSDEIIAIYNGSQCGGTYNCLKYAELQKRKIHIINPDEYRSI